MKKFITAVLLAACLITLSACSNVKPKTKYTVTFDSNGVVSQMPQAQSVEKNKLAAEPDEKPKAEGYIFTGWFKDKAGITKWNFTVEKVTENTVLYAGWIVSKSLIEKEDLVNGYVKWQGRTFFENNKVYFYNTASGFEINFHGTEISVELTTSNISNAAAYAHIITAVDDEVLPDGEVHVINQSSQIINITDLNEEAHTLRLAKRSEPQDSVNSVVKIETDGYFTSPPAESKLKMLFIGGSGITGHGSLGNPGEGRTSANSSSLHAFGYLTARMFDADCQFVSNSGWGVLYGSNPTNNGGKINLRYALDYVGIDDSENVVPVKYDLSEFVPDVVVVNAGGNDFTGYINGIADAAKKKAAQNAFSAAVAEMCAYLKKAYPKTIIIWTFTDAATGSASVNGRYAEEGIRTLNKYKEYIFPTFIAQVGSYGEPAGANGHAGLKTHIRNSEIIASVITGKLKIEKVRANISA